MAQPSPRCLCAQWEASIMFKSTFFWYYWKQMQNSCSLCTLWKGKRGRKQNSVLLLHLTFFSRSMNILWRGLHLQKSKLNLEVSCASKNHSIFINCGSSKRSKVVIIYRDLNLASRESENLLEGLIEALIKTCGNSRSFYFNHIKFHVILIHFAKAHNSHQLTSKDSRIMPKSLESSA